MKVLLLPGMDGTGDLFDAFVRAAPAGFEPVVVRLPPLASYEELREAAETNLADTFAIIAESFSGPIAIEIAARHPQRVTQLVLCNSFAVSPLPRVLRWLPWRLLFALPVPGFVIRYFLGTSSIPKVSPALLAARVQAVFRLDCTEALRAVRCPIVVLRGTKDRIVSRRSAEFFSRYAEIRELDGPHLLLQTKPQEAWAAISTPASSSPAGH